jgi:hypothetical protein
VKNYWLKWSIDPEKSQLPEPVSVLLERRLMRSMRAVSVVIFIFLPLVQELLAAESLGEGSFPSPPVPVPYVLAIAEGAAAGSGRGWGGAVPGARSALGGAAWRKYMIVRILRYVW